MNTAESRTTKSARNVLVSVLAQVLTVVLGFVTRTVFISQLGVAMVGVNSVLTSTLALLALADLGISGALMYTLYKPLREGDVATTAGIVKYAGWLFRWVALVVAVAGTALLPFVDQLVRLEDPVEHLELYYLVLLSNTVVGYLMLNRQILLNADQKIYLVKTYALIFNVLRSVAQVVSLLLFGSFLLFLVIQVAFTILNNIFVYHQVGRFYPYIRGASQALGLSQRKSILRSVRAMLFYRIGGLVLNNSTALLVSVIVGTLTLGYYSNYMLIIGTAVMVVEVAFSSLTPSVGNLVAAGDRQASRRVFDEMVLLSILINGAIAVVLIVLVDDFMLFWLGGEFVLPREVVIGMVLSFYVTGVQMPLWSFRSATGLFRQTRYLMLVAATLSIALAALVGPVLGLIAIVVAPTVSRLLTVGWLEPWLLIRDHLAGGVRSFFLLQMLAAVFWSSVVIGMTAVGTFLPEDPLASLLWKGLILMVGLPSVSWLAFGRTRSFKRLIWRGRQLFQRRQEVKS